jgi:DNA-directed RNA polymerase subunit RPC12/RpoP
MIIFICCGCGAALHIGDKQAGRLGRCPYCHANTRVPGNPRRTSKLTILARISCLPFAAVLFWALMFCIVDVSAALALVLGGVIALAIALFFLWGVTNFFTFLMCPREYWIWKRNGGDPWFDTLPGPLNTDPPETRFQELFREKSRQEWEANFGPLPTPSPPPDSTKSLDDPNVI